MGHEHDTTTGQDRFGPNGTGEARIERAGSIGGRRAWALLDAFGEGLGLYFDEGRARLALDLTRVIGAAGFSYSDSDSDLDAVRVERILAGELGGFAEDRLRAVDRVLGGHGVERITVDTDDGPRTVEYVEAGDTYSTTVLREFGEVGFWVGSLGDWVEAVEGGEQ